MLAAADARNASARWRDETRARLSAVTVERQAAEDAAGLAAITHKAILVNNAAGGPIEDPETAQVARRASEDHASDLRDTEQGLRNRLATLDAECIAADKLAARARGALCVARAPALDRALRSAAHAFARALVAVNRNAVTANSEYSRATGSLANVLPIEGRAALGVSNTDDGIPGIFAENGVGTGTAGVGLGALLEGMRVRARPLSERELLGASDDKANDQFTRDDLSI